MSSNIFLRPVPGGYAVYTPFDRGFVASLKREIPYELRRFDGETRIWLIDASQIAKVTELVRCWFQVTLDVPTRKIVPVEPEIRLLRLEYLGRAKPRDTGESLAYGWVDGRWGVLFPEQVLQEWFSAIPITPDIGQTYYAVLGVRPQATPEDIKLAYRRLARQWHPDIARDEPNAKDVFIVIQQAYEVLRDETTRRKYEAGLMLEASIRNSGPRKQHQDYETGYRAPLRCGMVLAEGRAVLLGFLISRVLQWEDVVVDGRVMVTSWPLGAKTFTTQWV